jgi:hypothetical protein
LAAAVWSALAAQYNVAGTMGEALDSTLKLPEFIALQNP